MTQKSYQNPVLQVVFPLATPTAFDYLTPSADLLQNPDTLLGRRVRAPLGRQMRVGIIIGCVAHSTIENDKLKPVRHIIDDTPLLSIELLTWLKWAASYYHQPLGSLVFAALPPPLRLGKTIPDLTTYRWHLTQEGATIKACTLKRAPRQWQALSCLKKNPKTTSSLQQEGISLSIIKNLEKKAWIAALADPPSCDHFVKPTPLPYALNPQQKHAIESIDKELDAFHVWLLHGITGSGKTEVYMQVMERVLMRQCSCLVMVPEISLTPQTIQRFQDRFISPIQVVHSKLSDKERLIAFETARQQPSIVLGTRSAIFSPAYKLGLIVIDEEHDPSFKQQDKFRYSARDAAIVRAKHLNIPIMLGSATPSLESWNNAKAERYRLISLSKRAGSAQQPQFGIINLCQHPTQEGLSRPLMEAIEKALHRKHQVLLYINRRGFAPVLYCPSCQWTANCSRCDCHMVYHQRQHQLRCHHCTRVAPYPEECPKCQSTPIKPIGFGTERLEKMLEKTFDNTPIVRIDKDTTSTQGALKAKLSTILKHDSAILVGTQMITKGHHFPRVTLVGVLNADHGLHSHDFRAIERLGQILIQVAGRSGRSNQQGQVLIQTHHPSHPLLRTLMEKDYAVFLEQISQSRKIAALPPFSHQAMFRAEAFSADKAIEGLEQIRRHCQKLSSNDRIDILGPVPSPMEKRQGKWRQQLLLQSSDRQVLQRVLSQLMPALNHDKTLNRCRWSLDVDPIDLF